jgi:hypothetical protein
MARRVQHNAMDKAIRHVIAETRLAYFFNPCSYTAGAFNAALAVAQVFEREQAPDWIAQYLDQQRDRSR